MKYHIITLCIFLTHLSLYAAPDNFVVGDGTPASCTEPLFAAALVEGGLITFDCGGQPLLLRVTYRHSAEKDVVIDGGGLITLDGQGETGILESADGISVTLRDIGFYNGFSDDEGGAVHIGRVNTLHLTNVTFEANRSDADDFDCQGGGAMFVDEGSTVSIENSLFKDNHARNGGALSVQRSKLTLLDTMFENNVAYQHTARTPREEPARVPDYGACGGGGAMYVDGTRDSVNGGADSVIWQRNRFIDNKTDRHGGAIFLGTRTGDDITLRENEFVGNEAKFTVSWSGTGGALFLGESHPSEDNYSVKIEQTTFGNNSAEWRGGAISVRIPLTIENSTFAHNVAQNPHYPDPTSWQRGNGGAIRIDENKAVTLNNVTIANNRAGYTGGGISGNGARLKNTVISQNVAAWHQASQQNCDSWVTDHGSNLHWLSDPNAAANSGCGTDLTVGDPKLGELDDHGGFSDTMPLLVDSAALDSGDNETCSPIDQRNVVRPQGGICDIGAVEIGNTPPVPTETPVQTETPTPEPTATPLPPTITPTPPSGADYVVGDGSAESCNENAFAAALTVGGTVVFNCGASPVTIPFSRRQMIARDMVIDGGGMLTFDGGGVTAILGTEPYLTVGLKNVNIVNGHSEEQGAGLSLGYWSELTLENVRFEQNVSTADEFICDGGGALFIGGGSTAVIDSAIFKSNVANNGGAINNLRSGLIVTNSHFENNHAIHSDHINQFGDCGGGGAIYVDGTRKPADGGPDAVTLVGNTYLNNTTNNHGGALFLGIRSGEPYVIKDSYFEGNIATKSPSLADAGTGGAIWIGSGGSNIVDYDILLENATFAGNHAERQGGGLWTRSWLTARNVTFVENTAIDPDISDTTNWRRGLGAAIVVADYARLTLNHATIISNTAGFSGGGIATGGEAGDHLMVTNSIIANNVGEWSEGLQQNCTHRPQGTGNLQWLAVEQGANPAHYSNCGDAFMLANPQVGVLALHGGKLPTLMLQADSAAIDAGEMAACAEMDKRGVVRPQGAGCDIGSVEVGGVPTAVSSQEGTVGRKFPMHLVVGLLLLSTCIFLILNVGLRDLKWKRRGTCCVVRDDLWTRTTHDAPRCENHTNP